MASPTAYRSVSADPHLPDRRLPHAMPTLSRLRRPSPSWPPTCRLVPVYRRLLSDALTPVSAFHKIDAGGCACLFESVIGGEKVGRYSFLAAEPFLQIEARGNAGHDHVSAGGKRSSSTAADPLDELQQRRRGDSRRCTLPELPPFCSGAVGYAGYDTVRYVEHLPNAPPDDRQLPDLAFAFYDHMVVFDNVNKTIVVVAMARLDKFGDDLRAAYDDACRRVDRPGRQLLERRSRAAAGRHRTRRATPTIAYRLELHAGRFRSGRREVRRVHPRRRHLSGRAQPAAGSCRSRLRSVRDLSHAAGRQSQPVHVLPAHARA